METIQVRTMVLVIVALHVAVAAGFLWSVVRLARYPGSWKSDGRRWKLPGLVIGCGLCSVSLVTTLISSAWGWGAYVERDAGLRILAAATVVACGTWGLAYWFARVPSQSRNHA